MRTRAWLALALLLPAAPVRSGEGDVRLLTDDAIPRYLARGQLLARNQEWEKVVDVLHRVVVGDKEVFPDLKPEVLHSAVYSEDGRLYYPARELCLKELARLPPDGLRAYRDAHDRDARDLFEKTKSIEDLEERLAKYAEVYDKFLPSTVGDDALELAGDINLALGRLYEALAAFRRLIDVYPKDTDRDLAMIFAKAAYCAARIGDREHRDVLLERLASEHPNARIRLKGKQIGMAALKDHELMRVRGDAGRSEREDWPIAGGNPARSRVGADLPEDLPKKPLWWFRIEERDARLHAPYGKWMVAKQDREPSVKPNVPAGAQRYLWPYPTVRPIVHNGLVLYKDYLEIVERRLGSGAMVSASRYTQASDWAFDDPEFRQPLRLVRPATQGNAQEAARYETIYSLYDYGGNSLVIGGGSMIAMESPQAPVEMLSAAPQRGRPNMLVAYSRATGKMSWAWHQDYCAETVRTNEAVFTAWQRDFQDHATPVFQGPGVISGGILYTIAKEPEELAGVSLWAINVDDGRVRFRTPLHYPDEMHKWLPRGASLAVAGGVVYIVTHAGIVAAVDALPPGRVRWINRYRRRLKSQQRANQRGPRRREIEQMFSYNEPVVSGGKVIVAPADADEMVAFDAETGRLAWSIPKRALEKFAHIVGVADGNVFIAGGDVTAIDVARGEPAWEETQSLKAWPKGRGFVGERYVYIPTRHENAGRSFVERFDVKTGARARSLEFDVNQLGNLLSIDGRLVAANNEEVMCFTTVDAEIDRIDTRLGAEGERADLLFERGLVALAATPKLRDQARADFKRAIAAAERAKEEDGPIRGYAVQNLFAIATEKSDLGALEEAAGIVAPLVAKAGPALDFPHHPYQAQIAYLRVAILGQLGRGDETLAALERFIDAHGGERVVRNNKVIEGTAAAGQLRDQMIAQSTAFRTAFEKSVRGRIQTAVARGDKETLRAMPARYENKPPSEESFFALAQLHDRDSEWAESERVLRDFIAKFPHDRRRAEAHLRVARLLLRQSKPILARRERFEGISRLDERGRAENAALLRELDETLETGIEAAPLQRIRIPLEQQRLKINSGAPVPIEGKLEGAPAGFVLFAHENGYFALDSAGAVLWTQPNPAGAGVDVGPDGEPSTVVAAAAIAAARFAHARGKDIIVGDVAGLMRLNAATGEVAWRYPETAAQAQNEATQSLALLHAELRKLKKEGHLGRSHPLPCYAMAGNLVVRVHPLEGVEAIVADSGRMAWQDVDIREAPIGPPTVMGELLAVGWASKPGRIRVYGAQDGGRLNEFKVGKLFAPPLLDPLGRVIIVGSPGDARLGHLTIVNARGQEPAHQTSFPVLTTDAAVLYADGKLIVYHDGASGTGNNLHFIDLEKNTRESRGVADLLRAYEVLRDGSRLFVFTHNPGLEDEGARLFRIDLRSNNVLTYDLPLKAHAYARPVLTRRYVAIAASRPRSAHIRLFDREASADSRGPQPVFSAAGGRETATFDLRAEQESHYRVPPALAVSGEGFVAGHPFGTARLKARDAR